MDLIFKAIECSEVENRWLATFQLTYAAVDWWEAEEATLGEEVVRKMPWVTLKERFPSKYFLMEFVQGNYTV